MKKIIEHCDPLEVNVTVIWLQFLTNLKLCIQLIIYTYTHFKVPTQF